MTTIAQEIKKETREAEVAGQVHLARSRWSMTFWWASMIQAIGATAVTLLIVLPNVQPSLARVMTDGGPAGTWLAVGYILDIVVGVLAVGLTAIFYHHLEVALNKPIRGFANYLAGAHLVLMNVGVAAVCFILLYGGYVGGANMLPDSVGGPSLSKAISLLDGLVAPAQIALAATAVGVLCGGFAFLTSYFKK